MSELLTFVVLGLATGSVYGLAGTGLVLTYRTSGIFNFAHGALAAGAAYVFVELRDGGMAWPVAAAVSILGFGTLGGVALERLTRALSAASVAMKIVATLGILLVIQGVAVARYGHEARYVAPFLPQGTIAIGGARLGVDRLIVIVLATAASLGLALFLKRSRIGAAMRAVVDDPALLDLAGTNPVRVRRVAWMIGASFASVSGILLAPSIGLDAILLTFLVVQAFGAAAVGRFSSLGLTYAGGLGLGVAAALATRYVADLPGLAGLPASLPFVVLFVTLVAWPPPRAVDVTVRRAGAAVHAARAMHPRIRAAGGIALAGAALAVPALVGPRLPVFTNAVVFTIVFGSMALLINQSGQVSLCHAAFAALGGTTFSHLTGAGAPWLVALLLAGLATVPLGVLVSIPATRLSGLYLALATFGLGLFLERMVYDSWLMFGSAGVRVAPRPAGFTSDTGFYYAALAIAVTATVGIVALRRGRLGRLLRATGDSPVALATLGTTVDVTRVLVFCLSAFLAGVAGGLFGALNGSVNPVGFAPMQSLIWLAVLALGGPGLIRPAILAAVTLGIVPAYTQALADNQAIVFGVAAIGAALASTGGVHDAIRRAADRSAWRTLRSPVRERSAPPVRDRLVPPVREAEAAS